MSIAINNNSYNYSLINMKGRELLQTSVCAECGKSYVSGGTTRTVTKTDNAQKKDYFITNYNDSIAKNFGLIFDVRV